MRNITPSIHYAEACGHPNQTQMIPMNAFRFPFMNWLTPFLLGLAPLQRWAFTLLLAACGWLLPLSSHAASLGTAFTYQGRLNDNGGPATGIYAFRLGVYDSASTGSAVAAPLTNSTVAVSSGLFAVYLLLKI